MTSSVTTVVVPLVVALFAASGLQSLGQAITDRRRHDRLAGIIHLIMSAVMIAMTLGWSSDWPALPQILTFSAAALWFGYRAVFADHSRTASATDPDGHSLPRLAYHVVMMTAMVWMAAVMSPTPQAMASMAGHQHGAGPAASTFAWSAAVSTGFGIVFAVACLWFLLRLVWRSSAPDRSEPSSRLRLAHLAATAAMAAGMALSFLVVM
jgi:hypothetical protein